MLFLENEVGSGRVVWVGDRRSSKGIKLKNKSQLAMLLPSTASAAMVDVIKDNDVFVQQAGGSWLQRKQARCWIQLWSRCARWREYLIRGCCRSWSKLGRIYFGDGKLWCAKTHKMLRWCRSSAFWGVMTSVYRIELILWSCFRWALEQMYISSAPSCRSNCDLTWKSVRFRMFRRKKMLQ